MKLSIFAYGSNMCVERIRKRVPSARPLERACLARYELRMHKRGADGSAKADAFYTGDDRHSVWGVLFEIHSHHKPLLDRHEHLGVGYDDRPVQPVTADGETVEAWIYVARREMIDTQLKPFTWYKDYMLAGARWHRLPPAYVLRLQQVEAIADHDTQRDARNRQIALS